MNENKTINLFEPFKFDGGVYLKNRVFMAPMTTGAGFFDGSVTEDQIQYYTMRAKDPGVVVVECCFVQKNGLAFEGAIGIDNDDKIDGLSRLAKAIQANGAKAFLQIYHGGRMVNPRFIGGEQPVAPSAVPAPRENAAVPRELTAAEVDQMVDSFAQAFRRAIQAGFDGVEIHGANTYLIQQFYSPHSNRREDEWGGSREKRAKFPLTILKKAHEMAERYAARPFVIGYRFSPEELEEPGIRFDDTMYLLEKLADEGVDYLHFSMGHYARPSLINKEDPTPLIKQYLKFRSEKLARVPIMGVGGIVNYHQAEEAASLGYDLLAVGKGYIAQPLWSNKALNREEVTLGIHYQSREELALPYPLWKTVDDQKTYEAKGDQQTEVQLAADGTYAGTAEGHNGPIALAVTFKEGNIEDIAVKEHSETASIFNQVSDVICEEILTGQTLKIDAISGATVLSKAILDATQDAIVKAGGSPAAYLTANEKANKKQEDLKTDLVVIGSGGAGLTAALKGMEEGKNVVVLEKNGYLGGATILNGSNIVATGSRIAAEIFGADTPDTPELLYRDIERASKHTLVPELSRVFAENVGKAVDWMAEHAGVTYRKAQTQTSDHSVNRQIEVHSSSSEEVISCLAEAIAAKGGTILLNTKAEELIIEEGMLKGVRVTKGKDTFSIFAEDVVLASGGYGANPAFRTDNMKHMLYYGPRTSTGDALSLVKPLGGKVRNLNWFKRYPHGWEVEPGFAKLTTYSSKKATDLGGIYINSLGKRIMNESDVYSAFRDKIEEQENKVAYLLMDEKIWKEFYQLLLLHGFDEEEVNGYLAQNGTNAPVVVKGSLTEIAAAAHVDAEALAETVSEYNRFAKQKTDEAFQKPAAYLQELTGDTYYLVEQKVRFATSLGGLVVDPDTMNVLDEEGREIPHLYAAGEIVGGANGNDSMPSMMNSWIVTSGFLAGQAVCEKMRTLV